MKDTKYRFTEIIENLNLIAIILDRNGRLQYCNPYLLRVSGYQSNEIIGKSWFTTFVAPEQQQVIKALYTDIMNGSSAEVSYESSILTRTGSEILATWNSGVLLNEHGNISGLASIGENITEQRKIHKELVKQRNEYISLYEEYASNNEELRTAHRKIDELHEGLEAEREKLDASEVKFQTLYKNTPVMLQSSNMQGEIVSVNDCWLETMDYSYEEVIGTHSSDYLTDESKVLYGQLIPHFIQNGSLSNIEAQAVTRQGKILDLLVSSKLLYNKEGTPVLTMTNLLDITYKKEVERKQEKINDQLRYAKVKAEESSRLKTAFLQNLSHEIRTPLNAICGFAQILLSQQTLNERQKRFHTIMVNSSNQLLAIVSNILTLASLETQQEEVLEETTHLNNLLDELLTIYSNRIGSSPIKLCLTKELNDSDASILTDHTKLRQVLTNLLNNALKFTSEGNIRFGYTKNTRMLRFYVEDDGVGIPADQQDIIFERFRQAHSTNGNYGGTGLGLAISKAFVEMMGGTIWVTSEEGKGACFYFSIPYKKQIESDN